MMPCHYKAVPGSLIQISSYMYTDNNVHAKAWDKMDNKICLL